MSELQSAHPGARAHGFVQTREMGRQGMVTLRGDLASDKLRASVKSVSGHDVPGIRGINGGLGAGVAWMSPDELMVFCDANRAPGLAHDLQDALNGTHHLALDVSAARAVFAVEGAGAREVIAKLSPVDMAPGRFEPGEIRRTRLAQIPAAFWMPDGATIHLVCFRSVARYAFDLLANAAQSPLGFEHWPG